MPDTPPGSAARIVLFHPPETCVPCANGDGHDLTGEMMLNVHRLERATEAGDGQHVGVVVALRSLRNVVGLASHV